MFIFYNSNLMAKSVKILLAGVVVCCLVSWAFRSTEESPKSLKCLVQLTNYQGEGAYVVISLINPEGEYEKTLYVMGEDEKWYPDLTEWWKYFEKKKEAIDAVSGATIAGGERAVCLIDIDGGKLDSGYTLRFETAVEDQEYYVDDVEVPLTAESITGKFEGKGYIRYIRIVSN